jgi:hypothetical protein
MRCKTATMIVLAFAAVATYATAVAQGPRKEGYDFHDSPEFKSLSKQQQAKLEKADRDLRELQNALNRYFKDHSDSPPTLKSLVPLYLKKLPEDPFATMITASVAKEKLRGYKTSLRGWGYRYRRSQTHSDLIRSVGLHDFPYRSASANGRGLYRYRAYYSGFILDVF